MLLVLASLIQHPVLKWLHPKSKEKVNVMAQTQQYILQNALKRFLKRHENIHEIGMQQNLVEIIDPPPSTNV